MRLASTGPAPDDDGWYGWALVVLALMALVGALGWGAVGCYPHGQDVPPTPSCAQDPTQPWCAPPAMLPVPDGGGRG